MLTSFSAVHDAAATNTAADEKDTAESKPLPSGTHASAHRFGIELSPVSPIVDIWAVRLSYSAWRYGDLIGGYVYQHEKIGDVGRAHGHTLLVGYRQFVWRGAHAEMNLWGAWDPITSYVDGRTYDGFDLWGDLWLGYRLDVLERRALDLYLLPQLEIGIPLYRQNPPPQLPSGIFVMPVLWLGARAL
jgi:hypothetical protein